MNSTRFKVSKLATIHRFPMPPVGTFTSRLLSTIPGWRGRRDKANENFSDILKRFQTFRISDMRAARVSVDLKLHRFYSKKKDTNVDNHKSKGIKTLRNLFMISLFTFTCGGTILLWSYFNLKRVYDKFLGNAHDKEETNFLYAVDPSDTDNFIKKHCVFWLPSKVSVSPTTWKLSQELSRIGADREVAIAKLSMEENMSDADCQHFAATLDLNTAIALAHTESPDERLFPPPPTCTGPSEGFQTYLGAMFRKILHPLPPENIHPNLNFLYRSVLKRYQPTEEEELQTSLDMYTGFNEAPIWDTTPVISDMWLLKVCLQAIISHTRIPSQIKILPKDDLLQLLLVIAKRWENEREIMSLVLKVLANVSCDPSFAEDIRSTGCLRLLVKFSQSNDIKLVLPAKRALHNLDRESSQHILLSGIYQLYPDFRVDESVFEYDIVFIHGILGGVFRTWRQQDPTAMFEEESGPANSKTEEDQGWVTGKNNIASKLIFRPPVEHPDEAKRYKTRIEQPDGKWVQFDDILELEQEHLTSSDTQCWPKDWLPDDCPNGRILAVDFDSFVTHWTGFCPVETTQSRLHDRACELLEKLHAAGLGKRPIIWVTHSMGGLLAKSLLCEAAVSNKEFENICANTKAVVFCSVPHAGSYIALAGRARRFIFMPTEEALELTNKDNNLTVLHERFLKLRRAFEFHVLSFGEMLETKSVFRVAFKMVPFSSADPEIGDFYPVKLNHLNTCKPHCKGSLVYRKIVELIHKVINVNPPS